MHLPKLPVAVCLMALLLGACAQAETPREPPRLLTNEQGCSITIDNQPINAYQVPSPMERACVGPYLLKLPLNYFSTQMGPQHDGSFSLALEYPSLQPFKPGERMNITVDVSIRTVRLSYMYIDRIDVWDVMQRRYTPRPGRIDDPAASLEGRIRGDVVHGLVPYYVDMDKVRAYHRGRGLPDTAPVMKPDYHYDWYVARDDVGRVDQLVRCTPREITESGVEYRDGKLVKKRIIGFAECQQTFVIEELNTIVDVKYPREGLPQWKQIAARARALLVDNISRESR